MARKSKGRQKIEITRMANESNRLVTFSKRRFGLFKKASELSTLCGVDIAVIVFSPAKKVFSFGHPSVESIVNRYLGRTNPAQNSNRTLELVEAHRNASVRQLNAQLTETISQLDAEKKRGEELDKMRKFGQENNWWEAPVDNLGLDELKKLKMVMEALKNNVANQKMMMEAASAANVTSFFSASSSSYGGLLGNIVGSGANDGIGLGPSMMPHGYALGYGSGVGHVGPSSVMDRTEPLGYGSAVGHVGPSSVMDRTEPLGYGRAVGHVGPSSVMDSTEPLGWYGRGLGHVGPSGVMDSTEPLGYGSGVGHVGPSSVMGSAELGLPMMPPNGYAQGYGYGRGFF